MSKLKIDRNLVKLKKRSRLRQILGHEFYILKRKLKWIFDSNRYAKVGAVNECRNLVFEHKSIVMRQLKDVDMYLQRNKFTNLRLAAEKINNVVIRPGETFSFWKLVGRPSARKGYLEGLVLHNGRISKGTGGGLCQFGNLLFWIFAHSPLTITERYRHSFDVFPDSNRTVPFGAGATLSYNYIDLQVKNETENTFSLSVWVDETHLHGQLFSQYPINKKYTIEERNHYIDQLYWGAYARHNQIFKIEEDDDGSVVESLLVENHALMMYSPLLSENKV